MLATVLSGTVIGLEGAFVKVEVDLSYDQTGFSIVGLPDTAVNEAREHVRSAINNSGYLFPSKQIKVNLAPADAREEGLSFDLPIAIGILLASGQITSYEPIGEVLFLGELAKDGSVHHTDGILPMVALASESHVKTVFVPAVDTREATLIRDMAIYPVETLAQLIAHLSGEQRIEPALPDPKIFAMADHLSSGQDIAGVRGQEHVKRALEVAASGGHNLLMSGPPGSAMALLARCMPSILPPMSLEESLEVSKIYSISGILPSDMPLVWQRPFRSLPHTIGHAGLVDGGYFPRPGEMSLAHRGVLYLEDLPKCGQDVLERLCKTLEDKMVTISWEPGTITYPATFLFIASIRPCPCGFISDLVKECTCSAADIARYQQRITGALLDHIDIYIEVARVDEEKLAKKRNVETSSAIRERVQGARERQWLRFAGTALTCNAEMGPSSVRAFCHVEPSAERLLQAAIHELHLVERAFHRVLKVARTIADLAESDMIAANHVAEAIQYRLRIGME